MTTVTGLRSQTLAKIQNTNISLDNDRIIITYDLDDAQPGEKFEVWLNITDASGVLIQGRRFSGDIGNNIEGGEGLVIYWNFEEDNVTLSDEISIQVMAESLYKKEISYIKALALSTVVPGWGLAKMEDKKLYGLIGLAGYGFIAAGLAKTPHPVYEIRFRNRMAYRRYLNKTNGTLNSETSDPLPLSFRGNAGTKSKPDNALIKVSYEDDDPAKRIEKVFTEIFE